MLVEGLVSTIIPVFNRATLLCEAVSSVQAQTYRPIEIILVDDGSTDNTAEVAEALQSESTHEIRVIRIPNSGPGAAREAGTRISRGDFIQYLDSDDLLLPDKFAEQVSGLMGCLDCDVSYGKTRHHDLAGDNYHEIWNRTGERLATMFPAFLLSSWWGTSTPLYRRRLIDQAGPWLPLRTEEDWEYDCRLASLGVRLHYCDSFISVTRSHSGVRLSHGGSTDPLKLADRAKAHAAILGHARAAGIATTSPEMQHFSRELFLLSRQCGAAGLRQESERLFNLSREASTRERAKGLDFRFYRMIAGLMGWKIAGQLAVRLDRMRSIHFEQT